MSSTIFLPSDAIPAHEIGRILILKTHRLGDVLLATPMMKATAEAFPHAQIEVLVYDDCRALLEGLPFIHRIWSIARRDSLANNIKLWRSLRNQRYDLLFHLTQRTKGTLFARTLGVRYRVAFPQNHRWQNRCFTHIVGLPRTFRHEAEQNLDALRRIGIRPISPPLQFPSQPLVEQAMAQKLREAFKLSEGAPLRYVHIHPASRWLFKCPPPQVFAQMIGMLRKLQRACVITSAPDAAEMSYTQAVLEQVNSQPSGATISPLASEDRLPLLINLSGQTTLIELAAVAKLARAFIGVDTLAMHISASQQTPIAAFFGPSGEKHWHPWQCRHFIIANNDFTCRPCGLAGCGNGGFAQCLNAYDVSALSSVMQQLGLNIDNLGIPNE